MKVKHTIQLSVVVLAAITMFGCTQMPTEKQSVADIRPQISFKISTEEFLLAVVSVDGLNMGKAGDYVDGVAALRVLAGTHVIKVELNGRTLSEDKVYLGDGVSRAVLIK